VKRIKKGGILHLSTGAVADERFLKQGEIIAQMFLGHF
jgi:hypothetical protein